MEAQMLLRHFLPQPLLVPLPPAQAWHRGLGGWIGDRWAGPAPPVSQMYTLGCARYPGKLPFQGLWARFRRGTGAWQVKW